MRLDLRKIMDAPGSALPFECELEVERLDFPSVSGYKSAPVAQGKVLNIAGVLHLEGSVSADMLCICDRCGKEFTSEKTTKVDVVLAEEDTDDDPDLFLITEGGVDVSDVMSTCFVLDMETKFLCSESCEGLGDYGPRDEIDPRLAVLQQLITEEE